MNRMPLLGVALALACLSANARTAAADQTAGALPPVSIELCMSENQSDTNPNLRVGIGFRDLKDADAVHIDFDVLLLDGSNNLVDTRHVSMDGKFASNIFIQPRRSPTNGQLLTQPEYPDSPAWNVANHFGSGVERVRCQVHAAKFADGTSWTLDNP